LLQSVTFYQFQAFLSNAVQYVLHVILHTQITVSPAQVLWLLLMENVNLALIVIVEFVIQILIFAHIAIKDMAQMQMEFALLVRQTVDIVLSMVLEIAINALLDMLY
jgi:hypothetical protein